MEKYDFYDINKNAWDYKSYEYWVKLYGTPSEFALKLKENPREYLKNYISYFDEFSGKRIINICGSMGKLAIACSLLGSIVTIVDISEHGKRYALELANEASTKIEYYDENILDFKINKMYDISFMYTGIAHYFEDLDLLFDKIFSLTKPGGCLIYSDLHPYLKIQDGQNLINKMNYFDSSSVFGEMPLYRYFSNEDKKDAPKCIYREHTLCTIINSIINSGFRIIRFDETPFTSEDFPCKFYIKAVKSENL